MDAFNIPISATSRMNCARKKQEVIKGLTFGDHKNLLIETISIGVLEDLNMTYLYNITGIVQPGSQIEESNAGRNTPDRESDPHSSNNDNDDCDRSSGNSEVASKIDEQNNSV